MPPKVSVVMPVYNGERFLRQAVDSILQQDFEDLEFIIVDDGSKDRTWDILQEYARHDPRVILLRNDTNSGVLATRNRGLAAAQGEYLAVQDADDISLPQRFSLQVAYLDQHPQVSATGGPAQRIDEHGRVLSLWTVPQGHENIRAHLLFTSPIAHTTMMARLALVRQVGGYQYKYGVEDYDLWWRLSAVGRIETLPDVLAQYRSSGHDQRITEAGASGQLQGSVELSLRHISEILPPGQLDEAAYKRFFMCSRGRPKYLLPDDIMRLKPLWDALAADPYTRDVAGQKLLSTSVKVWRARPGEALRLMQIVRQQFGISSAQVARKYARVYLRQPLTRTRKRAASPAPAPPQTSR